MDIRTEILNLLYLYADYIDTGDFVRAAEMFRNATVKSAGANASADVLLGQWREWIKIYEDGTPRTKHVITNPILTYDEDAGTATCRSYYTVLQSTDALPLQVIASGRYDDAFERVDGAWRFCARDYSLLDFHGDVSAHLNMSLRQRTSG